MKYEISNPSDKAFIESDDFETVCIATCILGHGYYGLKDLESITKMPIFIFGGSDEFFKENFKKSFEECLESADKIKLADAFESIHLAGERSSMNDIVKSAKRYAKLFMEG